MPEVDVVDETWLALPPHRIASTIAWPENWHAWWPELHVEVDEDRGAQGMRWWVRSATFHGSMEIYLQARDDGTLGYFFLRVDGSARRLHGRERARLVRRYRHRAKLIFWAISDRLDPGRLERVSPSRSL